MIKPQSLRQHLEQAFPDLAQNPDRLLIFVDEGNIRSTMAKGLSFEYRYTLNVILTDFPGDLDLVSVVLLDWVRVHQSELMANLEMSKSAIKFEADILDNDKVDLSITLPLTERIIVKREDDQLRIHHPPEPQYTAPQPATEMTLYDVDGQALLTWQSVSTEDEYMLEMPWTEHRHG